MKLAEQKCRPIQTGTPPLSRGEAEKLMEQIPSWTLADGEIAREFRFKDFRQAMQFTNEIAGIANQEDHHPDISISYNKVRLVFSTHKIGGLSLNDFIMAAKTDDAGGAQLNRKAA